MAYLALLCNSSKIVLPLLLTDLPEVSTSPKSVILQTDKNTSFNLKCVVKSKPRPIVKWQWKKHDSEHKRDVAVDGKRIQLTENTYVQPIYNLEITFSHIFVNDSGTYYCHAFNQVGSVTSKVASVIVKGKKYLNRYGVLDLTHNLNCSGPPVQVQNVNVVNRTATDITIMWEKPFDQHSIITHYVIYVNATNDATQRNALQLNDISSTILVVSSLKPFTRYSINVQAINDIGASPSSDISFATTIAAGKI